jgi:N,N-dimethylformamidase
VPLCERETHSEVFMLIGHVSDEAYAALADVLVEIRPETGVPLVVQSAPSGAIVADVSKGPCEICLSARGYGSKRVLVTLDPGKPIHFRLLADRLLGYAWPKWCRAGESVQFRVHTVEPYKLTLWRYGIQKELVRTIGWFDNHGPRACMQTLPDRHFVETGVAWDNGHGVHRQLFTAPERTGLYYFHAKTEGGQFFSFPLVVAAAKPQAAIAVLASTNTWNAYNAFGGRSNYIMAAKMLDVPIVNSKSDLPRYKQTDYGEWRSGPDFAPLSFDRPEPYNHVPERVECTDPIEGRQACHLAPAEWRLLGWLEQKKFAYDLYADYQLHDGTLDLDKYRVLILSVHPEYWSAQMYWKVKKWVFERGGRLLYLGGNGINCPVEFLDGGQRMCCVNHWPPE